VKRDYRFKGPWRGSLRRRVLAIWGARCAMCGWPGTDGKGNGLHLAHLVPAPIGAADETNLVPLCASCHRRFDARRNAAADADTPSLDNRFDSPSTPSFELGRITANSSRNVDGSCSVGAGSPAFSSRYAGIVVGCDESGD